MITNRAPSRASEAGVPRPCVILMHGLAAHPVLMVPLEARLQREGFCTVNWTYPSIVSGVRCHARTLQCLLARLSDHPGISEIHIAAHSMGSIITRAVLEQTEVPKLGRIVLLGPPNRGSHVATLIARLLARWCPALEELADAPGSFVNQLGEPRHSDVGIVAARFDRVVPEHSTHLDSISEHRVVDAGHSQMLFLRETADHVVHFLRHGAFADADRS